MKRIESESLKISNDDDVMPENITSELALAIFNKCEHVVRLPNKTPKKRTRRTAQLSWQTNVAGIRKLAS